MTPFTVTIQRQLDDQRIEDLLVGAFEGGSNYWIKSLRRVTERHPDIYQAAVIGDGLHIRADGEPHPRHLDRGHLEHGLRLMAEKYPSHMGAVLDGNDDAGTADVFLQLCLFGEVVYG